MGLGGRSHLTRKNGAGAGSDAAGQRAGSKSALESGRNSGAAVWNLLRIHLHSVSISAGDRGRAAFGQRAGILSAISSARRHAQGQRGGDFAPARADGVLLATRGEGATVFGGNLSSGRTAVFAGTSSTRQCA